MKQTTTESFDYTLPDNREVCISFTRVTTWSREHYGADADGNRGIWINTIDDDYVENITIEFYGSAADGAHTAQPLAHVDTVDPKLISEAVERYIETHDPKECVEPEPDYDDIGD